MSYNSGLAVDKNEVDQAVSGTSATVVTADHVLWDFNEDWDVVAGDFVVPVDGIFDFDVQMRLKNLVNVTAVEVAMFRRGTGPGGADEFWFTLGKNYINVVDVETHLQANTQFNFLLGERYCLKVLLSGVLPTANVSGDSTLTAWGFRYTTDLTGH